MTGHTTITGQLALPLVPPSRDADLAARITPGWETQAACRGMAVSVFFPPELLDGATLAAVARAEETARKVCNNCRVRSSCRAAALLGDEAGVWGGTTGGERNGLRSALSDGASVDAVLTTTIGPKPEAAA